MLIEFEGYRPQVHETAFVAPTATLIGNVVVGAGASVWYGAVLRGDHGENAIVVGDRSNVQDNCVIHVGLERGTVVGADVTIGHGAILEGCVIEDGCLIGMNAVVLDHVRVGKRCLIAANSTVLAGTEIPESSVAAGSPAVVKKPVSGKAEWWIERSSHYYVGHAQRFIEAGLTQ